LKRKSGRKTGTVLAGLLNMEIAARTSHAHKAAAPSVSLPFCPSCFSVGMLLNSLGHSTYLYRGSVSSSTEQRRQNM